MAIFFLAQKEYVSVELRQVVSSRKNGYTTTKHTFMHSACFSDENLLYVFFAKTRTCTLDNFVRQIQQLLQFRFLKYDKIKVNYANMCNQQMT